MLPLSDPNTCILRSPPGFQEADHCRTDEQASRPAARERECGKEKSLFNARIGFDDRSDEPDVENRYPLGPLTLPCLTASLHQLSSQERTSHTFPTGSSVPKLASTSRATMVDLVGDFTEQWCSTPSPANRDDNRDGCINQRLGSGVQRNKNRGEVEHQRSQTPHKLFGTQSGLFGHTGFCQGRGSGTKTLEIVDRQHDCGGVHQQERRHAFSAAGNTSSGVMDILFITPDLGYGEASSGFNEFGSRSCIPEFQHPHRMEVESRNLSTNYNYSILHT